MDSYRRYQMDTLDKERLQQWFAEVERNPMPLGQLVCGTCGKIHSAYSSVVCATVQQMIQGLNRKIPDGF